MEQSVLVELIQTLKEKEKAQVLDFAKLTFFSNSKVKSHVASLLKICLTHPWGEEPLTKEEVYALVYPGQPYLYGKLEKVMVEAHKVVRAFMLTQHYFKEENEFNQDFDFTEVVRSRGLNARYKSYLFRLQKEHKQKSQQHLLYFHERFLVERAVHDYESLLNQVKGDLNIPSTLDALDMHMYLNRLTFLNVYLLQQKAANLDVSDGMQKRLDETIIPERYLEQSVFIKINHKIFSILKKELPDIIDLQSLFDLILGHEKEIDLLSLNGFYTFLRNTAILILMRMPDNKDINALLFELYKNNLDRGLVHYEGKLSPSRYLAISECAARVEEFKWMNNFIEKYKHDLIGENETFDFYRYNKALYYFHVGDFSSCLDLIPPASSYLNYQLAGRILELKTLYELRSDLLSYKLDAYKMFLSRTSQKLLPPARRQKNLDFLNILVQICNSRPGDQKRAEKLIARVQERKQAIEWQWLLDKAHELKKRM